MGGNIYLSQYWRLNDGVSQAGLLSLAAAVAVIRALQKVGVNGVGVKWPNDIVYHEKKLAGILLEMSGETTGPCHIVVGLGLNIAVNDVTAASIDQPWTDLNSVLRQSVDRNQLVGLLVTELLNINQNLGQPLLNDYLAEWQALDAYRGKTVLLHTATGDVQGEARGVDQSGALQLAVDNRLLSFHSGEVSLRPAPQLA
jgi:BirA family biotin operon repressor/biotin-[acetyl-CoA-carboxylase] ligase